MAVRRQPYHFSVEDYDRMSQAGILGEDDRVELIEGEILKMAAIGSRHAACVDRLTNLLSRSVASRAIVRVQNPVRLDEYSEPEPDLALLRPRASFYAESHPGPGDVLLLVEVAETSGAFDRGVKVPLYARAGICEVWIVDVTDNTLEVHRCLSEDQYEEVETLGPGDHVVPGFFPDLTLDVADVLGAKASPRP